MTMKKFLAIYTGSAAAREKAKRNELSEDERKKRDARGMNAWMEWGVSHASVIVDRGAPLGKTKLAAPEGVSDIKNEMAGYVIVEAESHEAAAKLFENHPHFAIFPGDSVEIMECLPLPKP
jgi:predicted phosphoribosyltransferase